MSPVIDLAGARRRRARPPVRVSRAAPANEMLDPAAGGARMVIDLEGAYERLGPPYAPVTMPDEQRSWLRCWSQSHAWSSDRLRAFLDGHALGLAATLEGAQQDPIAQRLLAPELLLVLFALEIDPFSLRAYWPEHHNVHELLVVADLFGRPYSSE